MNQPVDSERYEYIDALRGLAILGVLLLHTQLIATPGLAVLRLINDNGGNGVLLFYIVSAFTLFLSIDQRRSRESHPIRNFFIRRFFRIAPLFYFAIVAYSLIYGSAPRQTAPNGIQWWQYPATVLFLNGWNPESFNSIIPVEWSVAVEMTFYLTVPALFYFVKDIQRAALLVIAASIVQTVLRHFLYPALSMQYPGEGFLVSFYLDNWFFGQLPIFGMGILAFRIFDRTKEIRGWGIGIPLSALAGLLMFASLRAPATVGGIPKTDLFGIAFICLLLSLHFHPTKILVNSFTRWIGKISFSLYLVHYAVIQYFVHYPPKMPHLGRTTGFLWIFLVVFAVSCGISFLTYELIENPGMNLGKRIIRQSEEI